MENNNPLLRRAPNVPTCCNECGRMAAVFREPRRLEEGLREALVRKLGEPLALRERIRDMRARGLLVEVAT